MPTPVIKVENVSKKFNIYKKNLQRMAGAILGRNAADVKYALKDVSFEVYPGEKVAIMGVVGSGCSTLLKIISGVSFPTKGNVFVDGELDAMLNARVGLDSEYPCLDNIYLKANVLGLPKNVVKKKEQEIIDFIEGNDSAKIPMKQKPKGTPIEIGLAMHLIKKSDILIVDEAFSSGGIAARDKCEKKLKEYMASRGGDLTMVMATNRVPLIKEAFSRGIVLDGGRIAFDGDAREACVVYKNILNRI